MANFPASPLPVCLNSLLLLLQLTMLGSVQFDVIGSTKPILALVGEDAELPCHLEPKVNAEFMEVRWSRSSTLKIVHLYKKGEDQFGEQMEEYRGRTTLLRDAIAVGSVALKIHNISISDGGEYRCCFRESSFSDDVDLILQVAASFFPRASPSTVALSVILFMLVLLIAGGLYLLRKLQREKGKRGAFSCELHIPTGGGGQADWMRSRGERGKSDPRVSSSLGKMPSHHFSPFPPNHKCLLSFSLGRIHIWLGQFSNMVRCWRTGSGSLDH
uniref:Ig-like domain-containing protein n=1 Tax=Ornithorhynchus anatinus TaxID=9258 RepID=A0A6I8PES9_ORNAN